ncbi:RcnB family protein [Luteimonas notoginsengisoli]|uniref:RcnB family protein n=1 Tax=Luteimonas notoginsengisoli TaxID=1578200 RepID=A0ABV7UR02_9GAMM
MHAPLKFAALLLAFAAVAMPASAAGRDHDRGHRDRDNHGQYDRHRGDRNDWNRHERRADRRDYRHDRRADRRDYRHDRRHDRRVVYRPAPRVIYRERYYAPRPVIVHRGPPRWSRGHRYYDPGYGRTYVVNDYYGYGLRQPPRGHYWRRSDSGDFLLVAVATGIITDLILHR